MAFFCQGVVFSGQRFKQAGLRVAEWVDLILLQSIDISEPQPGLPLSLTNLQPLVMFQGGDDGLKQTNFRR
jgi:hypothetical protein